MRLPAEPVLVFRRSPSPRRPFSEGTLRVGAFGATRPLKNLMSAAGAALEISRNLRVPLELWLSAGRAEGGGETVLAAVQEMLQGLPHVKLVLNGWQSWPKFRKVVGHMHLLLQPSYTESFNMVTADGIAEGVPSVVSSAIDWAPEHWKAEVDDVLEIARVGRQLLLDPRAAVDGRAASHHSTRTVRTPTTTTLSTASIDKHAVAVREKAVAFRNSVAVRGKHQFPAPERADKHQQA